MDWTESGGHLFLISSTETRKFTLPACKQQLRGGGRGEGGVTCRRLHSVNNTYTERDSAGYYVAWEHWAAAGKWSRWYPINPGAHDLYLPRDDRTSAIKSLLPDVASRDSDDTGSRKPDVSLHGGTAVPKSRTRTFRQPRAVEIKFTSN